MVDAGHGGSASAGNASQLFDPGAIAANGVEEKDVTLDVAKRVAALLDADDVRALLTRSGDQYLTIAQREQVANDNHASLFVSIHVNSYRDPSVGGSLVLYPNAGALPFATALSDVLGRELAADGVSDRGVQLRDNWWIHAAMPTATVEMAYLTNPNEAALLATEAFRARVAQAIRDGIEQYDPDIAARSRQIREWRAQHPGSSPPPARPEHRGRAGTGLWRPAPSPLVPVAAWLLVVAATVAAVRWPRTALRVVVLAVVAPVGVVRGLLAHRRALRRRRRTLARHAARTLRPRSVYEELWF